MKYSVVPTPKFKREAKRLIKKYTSLASELQEFEKDLAENPRQGTSLGNNTYKIRLAIKSKGTGKSGGARIITYLVTKELDIYLLAIYDKSEIENIDIKILKRIIDDIDKK